MAKVEGRGRWENGRMLEWRGEKGERGRGEVEMKGANTRSLS